MIRPLAYLLLALSLALAGVLPAGAKEKPLPRVMAMFENFNELEENFRSGHWEEAMTVVKKVEADYKILVGEVKGTVEEKTIQKFGFLIASVKKGLGGKNGEELEKPYVNLQTLFLDIMELYDYESPPVLIIVSRYLNEAQEALEKGEFAAAAGELGEIRGFKARSAKAILGKGGSEAEVKALEELAASVEAKAKAKDKPGAEEGLGQMKSMIGKYVTVKAE